MSKREFLDYAGQQFAERYKGWELLKTRGLPLSRFFARDVCGAVAVVIGFTCRPDNSRVHHVVGWAPTASEFLEMLRRPSPGPKPREGTLQRVVATKNSRDFEHRESLVSIGLLKKPTDGFDLTAQSQSEVIASMLDEIESFAFPYLRLMLSRRPGLEILTVSQ
jgi:hypothetical protein